MSNNIYTASTVVSPMLAPIPLLQALYHLYNEQQYLYCKHSRISNVSTITSTASTVPSQLWATISILQALQYLKCQHQYLYCKHCTISIMSNNISTESTAVSPMLAPILLQQAQQYIHNTCQNYIHFSIGRRRTIRHIRISGMKAKVTPPPTTLPSIVSYPTTHHTT